MTKSIAKVARKFGIGRPAFLHIQFKKLVIDHWRNPIVLDVFLQTEMLFSIRVPRPRGK